MKKAMVLFTLMFLILGSVIASAQMHSMKDDGKHDMMMGSSMDMPMMPGMGMMGGMGMQMAVAEDGGVFVMCMGKLYKYDKNLKLVKEVEIPVDFEHMKDMHKKMMNSGMMGNMNMMEHMKSKKEK